MNLRRVGFWLCAVLMPICAGAALASPVPPRPLPLRVLTTTTVFADLIKNVGGDRVQVTSLLPLGADPHTFDPAPREARAVSAADLFFYNGLGLESGIDRLIRNAARPDLVKVVLSEGLNPLPGVTFAAHTDAEGDPHFWLDVRNAMHYVRRAERALSEFDPAGAGVYAARTKQYLDQLEALDAEIRQQISQIPADRRTLVTYHDAFGYLARAYGLKLIGFLVRNPDKEPSPREMANLVAKMREVRAKAVFVEPQINRKFAQALAVEAGVRVGVLYSDTLTAEVPTYIDMMRANARALVEALQ